MILLTSQLQYAIQDVSVRKDMFWILFPKTVSDLKNVLVATEAKVIKKTQLYKVIAIHGK